MFRGLKGEDVCLKPVLAGSPASGFGTFGHLGEPSVPFGQREWRGGCVKRGGGLVASATQERPRKGGVRGGSRSCVPGEAFLPGAISTPYLPEASGFTQGGGGGGCWGIRPPVAAEGRPWCPTQMTEASLTPTPAVAQEEYRECVCACVRVCVCVCVCVCV